MAGPDREFHLSSSSSDASPEYESVKQCTPGLVEALKQCINGIADECLSKNLISEDVYGYIHANIPESEKASRILTCVRGKLKNDSSKFNDFVEVLQSDRFLEDILTQLKETHRRLSQSFSTSESLSPAGSSPAELTDSVFIPESGNSQATAEDSRPSRVLSSSPEVVDSVTRPESVSTAKDSEDIREFIRHVQNIKNARAFGLYLKIEPYKLDQYEKESANMQARIVVEWFKTPMSIQDRWDELHRVLQLPALQERRAAGDIQPFVRQQSSVDSAYSEQSNSSLTSSTEALQQYQMPYIEKIRCETEECTVQSALNYIAQYSEWYDIGINLGLSRVELEKMKQQYQHQDLSSHLVELWYRWDTGGLSWEKLYLALKKVVEERERRGSETCTETAQQLRAFHTQPSLPMMPEEPAATDPMEALEAHEETARDEIQNLEAKFGDIQLTLLNILDEKGMSVRIFKRAVKTYPGQVQLSIGNLKTASGNIEEIEDIFSMWSQTFVWSFLDITLLECIVKRHGTTSLQDAMREYAGKLKDFRQRTTVYTLRKVWPCPDPPKDAKYEKCKEFILTLRENAKECTLEKLELLRKRTCQGLILSKAALVLYYLKPGSITLIWLLPVSLVEHCKEALRKRVFSKDLYKQNKIIRLELDGDIFPIEEELRHAVRNGKIHMVDNVLKQWSKDEDDINEPDKDGKTALILAAEGDYGSIVVSLLESELGVDLDSRAKHKLWTALFFAYNKQHDGIVKLLLQYGADPTLEDIDGKIPEKVGGVKSGPVQKLVEAGKSLMERVLPTKKNLLALCKDGRVEDVRKLLQGKGDYDINMKDSSLKAGNWTPLMWACEKGHFEIVNLLLQYKADTNWRANNGWTAFHVACSNNHVRIVNLLLKNGADPNSFYTLQSEYTPLMYLSRLDDMEPLARSLLKRGANPNIPEAKLHWTPLTQASYSGKKELVLLYLENKMTATDRDREMLSKTGIIKTDIEMRTGKGWTALTAAIKQDRGEIVDILIDNGISTKMTISKRDSKSEPALHLACYLKCTNAVRVLVRKEGIIDVNETNADGLSALMIAIRRKDFRVVEALLESEKNNVNLQQRDTGLTAIFLAARKGNIRVFEKLLQCGAVDVIDSMSVLDVESPNKGAISASLRKHKTVMGQRQEKLALPEEEKSETARMKSVALSEATLQMQKLPKKIRTMDVNQRLDFLHEEIIKKYKKKMEHWIEHGTGSDETERPEKLPPTEQSSDNSDTDL